MSDSLKPEELHERAARRAERVREGLRKLREGHGADDLLVTQRFPGGELDIESLWRAFWAQAEAEGVSDPPGAARDALITYYGTHAFLEERYEQERVQLERT